MSLPDGVWSPSPPKYVACLTIPHLAAQVEQQIYPDRPLLIGQSEVIDYSLGLSKAGITLNMPMRRAKVLCPSALILSVAEEKYYHAYTAVLDTLDEFAPTVEEAALGCAYLDLVYGDNHHTWGADVLRAIRERIGFSATLGLATNKFVAEVAAASLGLKRVLQVTSGIEAEFLRDYSASILPLDNEAQRRLKLLGLDTVGAYAALPRRAVLNQFGFAGQHAHQLAHGIDERPIVPRIKNAVETIHRDFDPPLEDRAMVLAALRILLSRLTDRLEAQGKMCRMMRTEFMFNDDTRREEQWPFREPTSNANRMLLNIERYLVVSSFPGGLSGVFITLSRLCAQTGNQLDLFPHSSSQESKLRQTLNHLLSCYGYDRFYQATLLEPDSPLSERRFTLAPLSRDDRNGAAH